MFHLKATKPRKHAEKQNSLDLANTIVHEVTALQEVARKFAKQLSILITAFRQSGELEPLSDRVQSATRYFVRLIEENILAPVIAHRVRLQKNKKTARYARELDAMEVVFRKKISLLEHSSEMIRSIDNKKVVQH